MRIEIETNTDEHECETCGVNYAEGGRVLIDGEEVLSRDAVAHCYGGSNYYSDELLVMALSKIGHSVFIDGDKYHVTCVDDEYHSEDEA